MHPDELTRVVDRALRRLPAPKAPETLALRVMAAVRAVPSAAATSRSWMAWPIGWRVLSAAATIAILAGLSWAWPAAQAQLAPLVATVAEGPLFRLVDLWRQVEAISTAADVIWRTVVQPVGWVVLPLVLLMWVACATFGAVLSRVALGGATHS